jgi:hypothetical protein
VRGIDLCKGCCNRCIEVIIEIVKVKRGGIGDNAGEGFGCKIEVRQEKSNISVTDANKSTDDLEKRPPSKPDSCWARKEYSACPKIKLITALIGARHWNESWVS